MGSQRLGAELDWENSIWYLPEVNLASMSKSDLDKPHLVQLVLGLMTMNRDLARVQAARDAEEKQKLWRYLKWTRRLAIGALTAGAGYLIQTLLKILGI